MSSAEALQQRLPSFVRHCTAPRIMQFAADTIAFACSYILFVVIRFYSGFFEESIAFRQEYMALPFIGLSIYWAVVFWLSGLYANWYFRSPFDEVFTAMRTVLLGGVLLMVLILIDDARWESPNSRLIIFLYLPIVAFLTGIGRLSARSLQRRLRERNIVQVPVLLAGDAQGIEILWKAVLQAPALGYAPIGVVPIAPPEAQKIASSDEFPALRKLPVISFFQQPEQAIRQSQAAEVLLAGKDINHETLLTFVSDCEIVGVKVKILPDLYEIFSGQARATQIYGTPLIEVSPQLMKPWEEFAKRFIDILVSGIALLSGLPVWILVALAVKLDSPGPVFFIQKRVGKNGKVFNMYKFRSMTTAASQSSPSWTVVNDPRVTKVGKFIRKTHLDEIPQFLNVLLGDMSLVGPRPEQPFYVEKFTKLVHYYPRRLKVRPGITGWYQIKVGKYEETLEEIYFRLRCDFFYIENMSFKLDLEILLRTIIVVLKGHGQA